MREIKFRFWSNHLGNFVTPDDSIFVGALKDPHMNPMQFTGLIDMNKKEVYEGDILRITNPFTKTSVIKSVWWNGETVRFNGIPTSLTNVYEVIGNIYENPELIK